MGSKRISPRTANQRIDRITSDVHIRKYNKGGNYNHDYWRYRYNFYGFRFAWDNCVTGADRVRQLAEYLKDYFISHKKWPNASVRNYYKDRLYKRAMRLAKKEVKE